MKVNKLAAATTALFGVAGGLVLAGVLVGGDEPTDGTVRIEQAGSEVTSEPTPTTSSPATTSPAAVVAVPSAPAPAPAPVATTVAAVTQPDPAPQPDPEPVATGSVPPGGDPPPQDAAGHGPTGVFIPTDPPSANPAPEPPPAP